MLASYDKVTEVQCLPAKHADGRRSLCLWGLEKGRGDKFLSGKERKKEKSKRKANRGELMEDYPKISGNNSLGEVL